MLTEGKGIIETIFPCILMMETVFLPIAIGVKMGCRVTAIKNALFINFFTALLAAFVMSLIPAGIFLLIDFIRMGGTLPIQDLKKAGMLVVLFVTILWPLMAIKTLKEYQKRRHPEW